jgi:mono/diheme cytochrome c family protein
VTRARFLIFGFLLACALPAAAHDVITTKITWNREIIRILDAHCLSCHRPGGSAFSLATYNEGRPWAKAIQEEVLERRMPPWGAVKGFGEFKNDQGLTPEQLEIIGEWVDGGAPEGEDKDLPKASKAASPAPDTEMTGGLTVNGDFQLTHDFTLEGLLPRKAPENATFQILAEFPDGRVLPLLWMFPYKPAYAHPFLLKTPVGLPKGTLIRGIPSGAEIVLLPSGG